MQIYTRGVIEEILREHLQIPDDHRLFYSPSGMVVVKPDEAYINVSGMDTTPIPAVVEGDSGTSSRER
jgi:hypothetical protein